MQNNLQTQVQHMNTKHRNKRFWYRIVSALGCVVTFCTVYALILPAITLESANQTLACPLAVHQHSDACMDDSGSLICGEADFVVHSHDIYCYDLDENLVCMLPVVETHKHTDECYYTSAELVCETEAHAHDENCYEIPATGPTEGEAQAEEAAPVLVCEKSEHSHGEACYEAVNTLICEGEEVILHVHSEACYEEDVLICGMMEVLEHVHEDICFVPVSDDIEETEQVTEDNAPTENIPDVPTEPAADETIAPTEPAVFETTAPTEVPTVEVSGPSGDYAVLAADPNANVIASGNCGSPNLADVKWVLTDDGVLTISGTGDMVNYTSSSGMPWYSNRSKVTDVVIEEGVTSIGDYAFYLHENLTSISIPDGVIYIGTNVFSSCKKLNSVTIPDSVTSPIYNFMFSNCAGLESVTIGNGVPSIGGYAFQSCYALSNLTIGNSVTSIGTCAFRGCSQLKSLVLPDSVTSISQEAFSGCKNISDLTIGSGLTYISYRAFTGCSGLVNVEIPDTVTGMSDEAFGNCTGLTTVSIGSGVTSISSKAFSNCTSLSEFVVDEENTKYCAEDGVLFYKDMSILIIYPAARADESYSIPDGVKSIGSDAFSNCSNLTSIIIPDSVTTLNSNAISNCANLTTLSVGAGVTNIFGFLAEDCGKLEAINFDENNTKYCSIDGVVFNKNKTAIIRYPMGKTDKSYVIPSGVTSIEASAFRGCVNLENATLPDSLTRIGSYAFYGCSELTGISVPDNVTSIGEYSFYGCSKLTSIVLPDGVTSIGNYLFYGCSNLATVNIPASATSIGKYAFYNCSKVTSIEIPDRVTSIGTYAFYGCSGLTTITIPSKVTSIGSSAFYGCNSLKEMTIQNGEMNVTSCSANKLERLVIGKEVDVLSADFLTAMQKVSANLTQIVFGGPNYFIYTGEDFTLGRLTLTAGNYYADAQGILYRLNDDENAEIYNVPDQLPQGTFEIPQSIPAESGDSTGYAVTSIGNCAFKACTGLTAVTIHEGITHIGHDAFASCTNLTSVNGDTALSVVLEKWAAAGADTSTFRDTALWENGFRDTIAVTANVIEAYDDTGRKVTLSLAEDHSVLTGETVQSILTIDEGEANSNSVVRIYFQFENQYGSIGYEVGSHTFSGKKAQVCETEVPNTYYLEIEPLLAGDTLRLDILSTYENIYSGDSHALIWLEVLTTEQAKSLGNGVTIPKTAHMPTWSTKPDSFPVSKTASFNAVTFTNDGDNIDSVALSELQYTISMSRTGDTSSLGKDYMTSVDFVDTMVLPEHFEWKEGLVDAIRAGAYRVILSNSDRMVEFYVTIGDTEYQIGLMWQSSSCPSYSIKTPDLTVDENGNPQFRWTYINKSTTSEITKFSTSFYIKSPAIVADVNALSKEIADSGKPVTYALENRVSATQHFMYGDDQYKEASALKEVSIGISEYKLSKKTSTNSSNASYLGAPELFTVTVENNQPLPYTELSYVTDPLPLYHYIAPVDLATMFYDDTYGGDLSVSIEPATLYPPIVNTVTGSDGNNYTITQQQQGKDTPYEDKATEDPAVITTDAVMTLCWSDDQTHLLLTVSYNNSRMVYSIGAGKDYATIQEAFDKIGFLVTRDVQYTCTWDQTGQYLYCGKPHIFYIRSTVKDTLMRLTGDQDWYITDRSEYGSRVKNYAYAYASDGSYKADYTDNSIYRDFTLFKSAYLNDSPVDKDSRIESGNVLTYRNEVTHAGKGVYEVLPLVDNMEGAQVLLVSVDENPSMADQNLETMEYSGNAYYIMKQEGVYHNIQVGNYLADRVEITKSDNGLSTMIYWYLTDVKGRTTITAEYLALVSPAKSGLVLTDNTYQLSNEVWLNDHQTHRLYDRAFLYGSVLRINKYIVTNIDESSLDDLSQHDYSLDELSKRTIVYEGDTVTYRLMLQTIGEGTITVKGSGIYDSLPASLNSYWTKSNVSVSYVPAEGSHVDVTNGDSWYIDNDTKEANLQYLRWNDEFSAAIDGTLYIYVTLSFPDGNNWADYGYAYGDHDLCNTWYVYQLNDEVFHHLSVPASALLQKGVQLTGVVYGNGTSYSGSKDSMMDYKHHSDEDSLWYYTNNGQAPGIVTYSVTLYNSGAARLYLSDIQDVLPQGFTLHSLYRSDTLSYPAGSGTDPAANYGHNTLISVGAESVTYKSANIQAHTSINENGQWVISFTLGNSGSTGNLSYDELLGKYYLNSGEAVVFAYNCATNEYHDTQDVAHNTVAMPFYDYNGAGLLLDTQTIADRKTLNGYKSNNGNRIVVTNGQAELIGMDTDVTNDATQWLCSEVDVYRGSIMPGITKSAEKSFANVKSPVTWNIEMSNSGTDDMRDYTVTDVMMFPYQFTGSVGYQLYYDDWSEMSAYTDKLFSFGERTDRDATVTITGSNGTAELTVNGDYQPLKTSIGLAGKGSSGGLSGSVTIWVRLSRDTLGNEILSVHFPMETAARLNIPAGGRALMTLQTQNFGTNYENTTYFNTSYLTPSDEQPFDTEAVSQGNYTIYEEQDSVVSEANVSVSYGYATTSSKEVAELNNPNNKASATDSTNFIVLPEASNVFRYTLAVNNTGGDTVSKAMDLLVMIDNLPEINDHTTFYSEIPRRSDFKVNFVNSDNLDFVVSVNGNALDASKYSLEFSERTEFDSHDWNGTASDNWYKASDLDENNRSLNQMRSFRVVITDNTGTVIPADADITVSFNALVDISSGVPAPSKVAWNSFGYHYSLVGEAIELEAAPQKVGVKMPSVPNLVKYLEDSNGNDYYADDDATFRFVIYEGNAVSLPENYSEADIYTALRDKKFTVVSLSVKAGDSASDLISLEDLYHYVVTDEGVPVQTEELWNWKNLTRYTLVELPTEDGEYSFGAINANQSNNFTFSYTSASSRTLTCTNIREVWEVQLNKLCQATQARLSGAVFGIYSPELQDRIGDEVFAELISGLKETPETEITKDGTTWYLMDIQASDSNGFIEWTGLTEERYYILELQAPDGYFRNAEPGQIVSADGNAVVSVTVTNDTGYELPATGGSGLRVHDIFGAALMASVLMIGCNRKRKQKKNCTG